MKKLFSTVLTVCLVVSATNVWSRDDIGNYSIKEVMDSEMGKNKLGDEIKFYFGKQKPKGKVEKKLLIVGTNQKTNALNKSDKEACQWVFLSAMIKLRDRAIREGGNAVIDIRSNYRNNLTSSETTFQCGAGTFVAGVALKGTIVKLK